MEDSPDSDKRIKQLNHLSKYSIKLCVLSFKIENSFFFVLTLRYFQISVCGQILKFIFHLNFTR